MSEGETQYSKPMPWIGMYIAVASLFCILAMVADLLHGLKNRKLWFPCKYFTLNAASLTVIAVAMKLPVDLSNQMGGNLDHIAKFGSMVFMCTMMANLLPSLATMNSSELLTNIIALDILVITLIVNVCIQIYTGVIGGFAYDFVLGHNVLFEEVAFLYVDQIAKFGSMVFMCTMMANLLPSLATMNSSELLTNIIALDILVITLIVNVCIQIYTGVIGGFGVIYNITFKGVALLYVVMLLILLIIHTCSGLTILKSKQIIELKYRAGHETALKDLELQQPGRLSVAKLKQHVKNHWIMAGTGSPQFITACSATTSASGVICVVSNAIHFFYMIIFILGSTLSDYDSDYGWSIPVILIIQFIGSLLGTIAPLCRCFAAITFKLSIKWIWNHIKVFKVESYWTQKLYDWEQSSIPFSVNSRKTKIFIHNIKFIFLIICIGLQKTVVVACKMIALIPIFLVICILFCIRCWKWVKAIFSASSIVMGQNPEQQTNFNDLRQYVLQLQDDMELSEGTLKSISKSVNRLIVKAEKQQPNDLMKLLEVYKGFEGVGKYDSLHVPPLSAEQYLDCWSLPLLTLTAIAISLPKIQNDVVDRLLSSVSEGLTYVRLVEESLNATDDYVSIQKAAKVLWVEVEVSNKWIGNTLKNHAHEVNTAGLILQWFKNTAKNMVTEVQSMDIGSANNNSIYRSICANSMYRITESILLSYHTNIDELTQEDLFTELSSMIADILAACLTNLPQVIVTKCHESVIEKRESSVNAAAQLLGETIQILNILQDRELPNLDPAELPFIDKWRDYLNHPSP